MKAIITTLILGFSISLYSQENRTLDLYIPISWEQLSAPLSIDMKQKVVTKKYTLLEVDLSKDLRKQYKNDNGLSMMYLPKKQYIKQHYDVAIPQPTLKAVNFTISGGSTRSAQSNTVNKGIKNIAYKDASTFYDPAAFCPITGAPL